MRTLNLCIGLLLSFVLFGQHNGELTQANKAYQEGRYLDAIVQYETLLGAGYQSVALEYNLGNAYYREGELAQAILHYERALRLSPADKDIQYNLDLVNEQLPEPIDPLPTFFLRRWWKSWVLAFSANIWAALGLILLWVAAAGMWLRLFNSQRSWRRKGAWGAILGFPLALVLFLSSLGRMAINERNDQAIVMEDIALKAGPDPKSPNLLNLYAGYKVEILDQLEGWLKISLANGELGWLEASAVQTI